MYLCELYISRYEYLIYALTSMKTHIDILLILDFLSVFTYSFERSRGAIDLGCFTMRATRKTKGKMIFHRCRIISFDDRWDLWGKGRISWKRVFTVAGHALRNSFPVPPAITHTMVSSSSPLKFVQATTLLRTASSVHLVRNEITKSCTRDRRDIEKR